MGEAWTEAEEQRVREAVTLLKRSAAWSDTYMAPALATLDAACAEIAAQKRTHDTLVAELVRSHDAEIARKDELFVELTVRVREWAARRDQAPGGELEAHVILRAFVEGLGPSAISRGLSDLMRRSGATEAADAFDALMDRARRLVIPPHPDGA